MRKCVRSTIADLRTGGAGLICSATVEGILVPKHTALDDAQRTTVMLPFRV